MPPAMPSPDSRLAVSVAVLASTSPVSSRSSASCPAPPLTTSFACNESSTPPVLVRDRKFSGTATAALLPTCTILLPAPVSIVVVAVTLVRLTRSLSPPPCTLTMVWVSASTAVPVMVPRRSTVAPFGSALPKSAAIRTVPPAPNASMVLPASWMTLSPADNVTLPCPPLILAPLCMTRSCPFVSASATDSATPPLLEMTCPTLKPPPLPVSAPSVMKMSVCAVALSAAP